MPNSIKNGAGVKHSITTHSFRVKIHSYYSFDDGHRDEYTLDTVVYATSRAEAIGKAIISASAIHPNYDIRPLSFGGYRYRSCEDILEAVKPLLQEFKCALYISDRMINLGERFYIEATATIENADGKTVTARGYAREEETKKGMDAAQITGSASSYARKYALNGLFCIDDTKDPDSNEQAEQGNAAPSNPAPAPVSTGMTLFPAAKLDDPVTVDALCKWLDRKLTENPKATPAGILEVKYIIDRDVLVQAVNTYYEWKAMNNQQ